MTNRDILARVAIAHVPHMLTLLDRDPHSQTYGCFDRNYWHYKVIDFPSGMSQAFAAALAYAFRTDLPGNMFYGQAVVRDWAAAGIRYAAASSHRDGSCDDYYLFEKATGATAFSLISFIDTYKLLGLEDPDLVAFFQRRARWLAHRHESGRLTNHEVATALALFLLDDLLQSSEMEAEAERRLSRALSWQTEEGWFEEYGGFDPAYDTLTISLLARIQAIRPSHALRNALSSAVRLALDFIHPDGSFGGEYGHRNAYIFYPHGFELVGQWMPEALTVNDRFLGALQHNLQACHEDDRGVGLHMTNYLMAWEDFVRDRPAQPLPRRNRVFLDRAQVLVDRRPEQDTELYIALGKGGVFKLFRNGRLVMSDTQLSVRVREKGSLRTAVGNLAGLCEAEVAKDELRVCGHLGWSKRTGMNTWRLVVLRLVMGTFGRLFPDLIRGCLQNLLIVGANRSPLSFVRRLSWNEQDGRWHVRDELRCPNWKDVVSIGIGRNQTTMQTAGSRVFQAGQLAQWLDLTDRVRQLRDGEPLETERVL